MFSSRKGRLIGLIVGSMLIASLMPQSGALAQESPQELVVGVGAAAGMSADFTVDPYESPAMNVLGLLLYDPLVIVDRNGVAPALATSWDISADGKAWTFHLRKGVKFHDASEFDAQAAKFSINKAKTKTRGMMSAMSGEARYAPQIKSVDIVDKYTIAVHLERPCGAFLENLSMFYLILSPQSYSPEGRFAKPIGTGPFILSSYSKRRVELLPFKDCWRGAPKLDRVVIRLIPDPQALAMALEAGELDMVAGGGGGMSILYSDVKRLESDPRFRVYSGNSALLEFIRFNSTRSPFDDIRVRQAVNYALDRQAIIEAVFEGYGVPCKGPIGYDASIRWTDPTIEGCPYDPTKARQLLAETGWGDRDRDGILDKMSKPFTVTLTFSAFYPYESAMAEMIQYQLKQVGIRVKLQQLEMAAYMGSLMAGSYDFALQPSMGKGEVNPDPYLNMFFHSKGVFTTMRNRAFDQAFDQAMTTTDHEQRQQLYYKMQQIIMEEYPAAFLIHPAEGAVIKREVKGFQMAYAFDILRSLGKVYRQG